MKTETRLEQIIKSIDQGAVQPSDLAEVTKGILDVVKNIKEQLEAKISNTSGKADGDIASTLRSIEAKERTLNELINTKSGLVLSKVLEIQSELKKDIQTVHDLIPTIPELPDLEPLEKKINALELKLPEIITKEPFAVRDALELIVKEEDKLDQSAIKNLEEDLKKIGKEVTEFKYRGGQSGSAGVNLTVNGVYKGQIRDLIVTGSGVSSTVVNGMQTLVFSGGGGGSTIETPTGDVDAVNTVFTVSAEPAYIISDGVSYFDGQGYTYAALTVTMTIPPSQYIRAVI